MKLSKLINDCEHHLLFVGENVEIDRNTCVLKVERVGRNRGRMVAWSSESPPLETGSIFEKTCTGV